MGQLPALSNIQSDRGKCADQIWVGQALCVSLYVGALCKPSLHATHALRAYHASSLAWPGRMDNHVLGRTLTAPYKTAMPKQRSLQLLALPARPTAGRLNMPTQLATNGTRPRLWHWPTGPDLVSND